MNQNVYVANSETEQEQAYLRKNGYEPDEYTIMVWPDSQDFIGRDDVELINDSEGLELFGSSAYIVPRDLVLLQDINAGSDVIEFEEVDITAPFEITEEVIDPEPLFNSDGSFCLFPVNVNEVCQVVKDIQAVLDTLKSPSLVNRIKNVEVELPLTTALWNKFSITINGFDLPDSVAYVRVVTDDVLPLMASVKMKWDIGVTIETHYNDLIWKATQLEGKE